MTRPSAHSDWNNVDLWRNICPELSIQPMSNHNEMDKVVIKDKPLLDFEEISSDLLTDGYSLLDDFGAFISPKLIEKLTRGIVQLKEKGWPASMILLFDETWMLAQHAAKIIQSCTHPENILNFDLLAWHIDPSAGESGFSPHRDRQPENVMSSFHQSDHSTVSRNNLGHAKYVTLWLALTDATPENSCLYVIPAINDPGYLEGDDNDEDQDQLPDEVNAPRESFGKPAIISNQGPLQRALRFKESYQNIRAIPRNAGQAVLFTHRIMHWGSKGNPRKKGSPRIAISFVASHESFEKPYVKPEYLSKSKLPPFEIRLLLVCSQLLIYYQRFNLSRATIRTCYDYVKAHESELEPVYLNKVCVEFVKALKEAQVISGAQAADATAPLMNATEDASDDEEAMLEEMLNAKAGGYGDFEDDYDETEGINENNYSADEDDDEEETDYAGFNFDAHIKKRAPCADIISKEDPKKSKTED